MVRGFTLIELLITCAILGVLITLASLAYSSLQRKIALNNTVEEAISALQTVQSWAMMGQVNQDGSETQCFRLTSNSYQSPCGCSGTACKISANFTGGITAHYYFDNDHTDLLNTVDISFNRLSGIPKPPSLPRTLPVALEFKGGGKIIIEPGGKIYSP